MNWKDERLAWDEMFMMDALNASGRSSCLYIHTGAVIVKDKRIVATGYNGAGPDLEKNCLDVGCFVERAGAKRHSNTHNCVGVHAETNAIIQVGHNKTKGGIIYTVFSPCFSCAKQIESAQLSEVCYLEPYTKEFDETKKYLNLVNIPFRKIKKTPKIQGLIDLLHPEGLTPPS